ncbi:MAG: hypothetical protein ACYC3X_30860 [Pirellulaceae bacterium]
MKRTIRLGLARVFEHCPKDAILTGVFSAVIDGDVKYEFAIAGEAKLQKRLELPANVYLSLMLSIIAREFEDHHGVKPAFVMEWYLGPESIAQGAESIAEEIERQVLEESRGHTVAPEELLDMDYELRVLRPA